MKQSKYEAHQFSIIDKYISLFHSLLDPLGQLLPEDTSCGLARAEGWPGLTNTTEN